MSEYSRNQLSLRQPELKDDCKDLLSWNFCFKLLVASLWTCKRHSPILISNKGRLSLPLYITYLIRGHRFQTPAVKCEMHNLYNGRTVYDQILQKTAKLSGVDSSHYLNRGMLENIDWAKQHPTTRSILRFNIAHRELTNLENKNISIYHNVK